MNYDGLIAALTPAVDAAGSLILDIKAKGPTGITKSDGSPVTVADQKAENILLSTDGFVKVCVAFLFKSVRGLRTIWILTE